VPSTGAEALALALTDGGIGIATAFPGSPATALAQRLETVPEVGFRWSVNENTALSHAFGAAMAGTGAVAIMKHVGVNVASDALQVMAITHTLAAPLILVEGADARPGSSQNAQDNRPLWAASPDVLVLAPGTVEEVYLGTRAAIEISRALGMLVVVRGDTRMFKAQGELSTRIGAAPATPRFARWPGRGWPLSTSARTHAHHLRARRAAWAALAPFVAGACEQWRGEAPSGVAAVLAGHLGRTAAERLAGAGVPGLRLLVEHPLPEATIVELLRAHDTVAVLEECLTHLEIRVRDIAHRHGIPTRIVGRGALGDERPIGWLEGAELDAVVARLTESTTRPACAHWTRPSLEVPAGLAGRGDELADHYAAFERAHALTGFPAADPRAALFDELVTLGGARPTFVATDPGITGVLALAGTRSQVKMHMGSAVPIAAGWARAVPDGLAIAAIGDTNLPHSEWLGIVESLAAGDDLLVVVVDNGHSEMTQRIVTLRPSAAAALASFAALGAHTARVRGTTSPADPWAAALRSAAARPGVRIVWVDA
jgi:indolepyruvate ferredoxin oxidoreductase alpha subunit